MPAVCIGIQRFVMAKLKKTGSPCVGEGKFVGTAIARGRRPAIIPRRGSRQILGVNDPIQQGKRAGAGARSKAGGAVRESGMFGGREGVDSPGTSAGLMHRGTQ